MPATKHEHKVERLLLMKQEGRTAAELTPPHTPAPSARATSPAPSHSHEKPGSSKGSAPRRPRSVSAGTTEDIYAYTYPSYSYSSKRHLAATAAFNASVQGQGGAMGAGSDAVAAALAEVLAGQKRPRSRSFHS